MDQYWAFLADHDRCRVPHHEYRVFRIFVRRLAARTAVWDFYVYFFSGGRAVPLKRGIDAIVLGLKVIINGVVCVGRYTFFKEKFADFFSTLSAFNNRLFVRQNARYFGNDLAFNFLIITVEFVVVT